MRALGRLVRPELRGRRLRAMLLLLLVTTLASAAMVAGLSTQDQAGARWDAAFRESNGAHVTISSDDPAALARVAVDPRVVTSTPPYDAVRGEVRRANEVFGDTVVLSMGADQRPDIARPLLREGRWVAPGATGEAVVDRAFALSEDVSLGDRLTVRAGTGAVDVEVVGQALNLRDTFWPDGDATIWIDAAAYTSVTPADPAQTVFLRLRDPSGAETFVSDYSGVVGTMDWLDTRTDVLRANSVFGTFLQALGVFVMVAAAIVVAGSVATRVLARRRDIGLLKAVGVTPAQVTSSVVLAHVTVAAIGVLAGWLLGGLLTGATQLRVAEVLGSAGPTFDVVALLVALVVVEALVVVATGLPAWRAGRVPTAAALAPVALGRGHRSRLAVAGERLGLGPVTVAGLRDAFARPTRALLTALALAVAVVAVLVTSGMNRTIDRVLDDTALAGQPEEVVVHPSDTASPDAIARVLGDTPQVASWFTETGSDAVLHDEQFLATAVGGDVARAGFVVQEGRMLENRGEAVTGYGFLQRFGVEVGDRIEVRVREHPLSLTVVGWYGETEEAGEMLMFPHDDLVALSPRVRPDTVRVNLDPAADRAAVAASLDEALGAQGRAEPVPPPDDGTVDPFKLAVALISGLVIVVALTNLGSTLVLVVRERSRDLAVLRAVGFTPRQTMTSVAVGGGVLAVVAVALGVPLGWALSNAVNEQVGVDIGLGPGIAVDPSPVVVGLVVPLAVLLTAVLAVGAARHAARAEVSELVRYE